MAGAEKIKERILEEAQSLAKTNIKNAEEEALIVLKSSSDESKKKQKDIIDKAFKEAVNRKSRLVAVAELEGRKQKLNAKQEMIGKVFVKAIEKLKSLPDREYEEILESMISDSIKIGDEEVILSQGDKARLSSSFIENINNTLKEKGKKGSITLSDSMRNINGGFILKKGDIETNNSFDSIIKMMHDELEKLIVAELF